MSFKTEKKPTNLAAEVHVYEGNHRFYTTVKSLNDTDSIGHMFTQYDYPQIDRSGKEIEIFIKIWNGAGMAIACSVCYDACHLHV